MAYAHRFKQKNPGGRVEQSCFLHVACTQVDLGTVAWSKHVHHLKSAANLLFRSRGRKGWGEEHLPQDPAHHARCRGKWTGLAGRQQKPAWKGYTEGTCRETGMGGWLSHWEVCRHVRRHKLSRRLWQLCHSQWTNRWWWHRLLHGVCILWKPPCVSISMFRSRHSIVEYHHKKS